MDPVEERRNKRNEQAREMGRGFFQFHGYQGWTHEDYTVFLAGCLFGFSPEMEPKDFEQCLYFGYGFHDSWQDWQQIKARHALEQQQKREERDE